MSEIIFLVEEAPEGGYFAKSMGYSIFTEGETIDEVKENIKDAVKCHFDEDEMPKLVRMHFVRDVVFAL
jgi:predicted RNase H-like HicB family nuclease